MIRIYGIILGVWLFFQTGNSQNLYPAWFVHVPPSAPTAVGYAPAGYYIHPSIERAIENGLRNLALTYMTRVSGEEGGQIVAELHRYAGNTYRIEPDSTMLARLKKRMVILDTAITRNMILVLVSTSPITVDTNRIPLPDTAGWITEIPTGDTNLYSIGVSDTYFYEHSGWQRAEKDMRIKMALAQEVKVNHLARASSNRQDEVFRFRLRQMITGCQVVERVKCNHILYVLGRMKMPLGNSQKKKTQ